MPHLLFAYANDLDDRNRYLRGLSAERAAIVKAMEMPKQMGLCQTVEVYDATVERIVNAFQAHEGEITLFHFGGHAGSFDLLLQDQPIGGEGLISFLGSRNGLQMVFLNGCHTVQLAEGLAEAGVPLVIGTDEVIIDAIATGLARRFYQGLGVGLSIQRAFQDAVDEQRMSHQGGQMMHFYRSLDFGEEEAPPSQFPWRLHVAAGKEDSLEWSLAQDNPLLGLPEPAADIQLPEEPYLFFKRYEREHAKVFFGRARQIRQLYERIVNPESPPLILLHGQSGAGKSSFLEAGLLPRMEKEYEVAYIRRETGRGLASCLTETIESLATQKGSFQEATTDGDEEIDQLLDQLEQKLTDQKQALQYVRSLRQQGRIGQSPQALQDSWLEKWQQIVQELGKPLLLVLDQAEESFTQQDKRTSEAEWEELGSLLTDLFGSGQNPIQGKLILSFRKEYLPEIESYLKSWALPRSKVFLPTLNRDEIKEIVLGLTSNRSLRERYGLQVAPNLPEIIANDLLREKEETVAPILQILLTNMWNRANRERPGQPDFDLELYQDLKAKWWELDHFVHTQIREIEQQYPEAVQTGLLLDLLYAHTTTGGSSMTLPLSELQQSYQHIPQLDQLLITATHHLLLRQSQGNTAISHDTLAPIIRTFYQQSDRPSQRARRILEGRTLSRSSQEVEPLDRFDLAYVRQGQAHMRVLKAEEEALLEASEAADAKRRRQRNTLFAALIALACLAVGSGIVAYIQQSQKIQTELSLEQLEEKKELLDQAFSQAQDSLQSNRKILSAQKEDISQLLDSTESLSQEASVNAKLAQQASRRYRANQLAADALSYLQQGKKYEATQAAVSAYQQDKQSPAVWGALLNVVHNQDPIVRAYDSRDALIASSVSPINQYKIDLGFSGFSIQDQEGENVFSFESNDILQEVKFVQGYEDRVYVKLGDSEQILIWQSLTPLPEIRIPGNVVGLGQTTQADKIGWADAKGNWGYASTALQRASEVSSIQGSVRSLATSPDGQYVLIGKPTSFDLFKSGDPGFGFRYTPKDQSLEVRKVRFSPKGRYLLAALTQGKAGIYALQADHIEEQLIVEPQQATDKFLVDLCMSPNEGRLFTIDNGKSMHLWDWQKQRLLDSQDFPASLTKILAGPNQRLLIASSDGQIYRQQATSQQLAAQVIPVFRQNGNVADLAVLPGSQPLLAIATAQQVQLFDWNKQIPIWTLYTSQQIQAIAFSSDGQFLWIGTKEGLLSPYLIDPIQLISLIQERNILKPES